MTSFRTEPYLWIHLAGIAIAPLTLLLAWLGLGMGDPLPFYGVELGILGAIAILPVLWMQWVRPFDFFSLLIFAVRPESLTLDQSRTLSRLKTSQHKTLSLVVAIAFAGFAWQLYYWAPLASPAIAGLPHWRLLGLAIAAIALLLSHLFIQVPASALAILLTPYEQWLSTPIYDGASIAENFTVIGWRVRRLPLIPVPEDPLVQPTPSAADSLAQKSA